MALDSATINYTRESQDVGRIQSIKRSNIPNFMVYQGKVRHCWQGRCILGAKPHMVLLTFFLINFPPVLFYISIIPVSISPVI